jgi:hypothetical protein
MLKVYDFEEKKRGTNKVPKIEPEKNLFHPE